jgi:hypothetical protein
MQLGIIAGSGQLPILIAKQNKNAFVLCIDNHALPNTFKNKSKSAPLLEPDLWIEILNKEGVTHIVLAGKVHRPKNFKQDLSKNAHLLLKEIISVGDNGAVNIIENFFLQHNFNILPISLVLKKCFLPKGFLIGSDMPVKLKNYIIKSSEFGIRLLNALSSFDVGQSIAISSEFVHAIEGSEGTDEMIKRAGKLSHKNSRIDDFGPVLIKIPKLEQNKNIDLPVIGINTIKRCLEFNFSSIVVSSEGTIILDYDSFIKFTKKNKFSILSI